MPTRLNWSDVRNKARYFKHLSAGLKDRGSARIKSDRPLDSEKTTFYGATRITVAATVSVTIAVVTASAANGVITNSRWYHGVIN